jgi:hypothetical protein
VPGTEWGDEAPWLADVADVLADGVPSVTVLINGGDIAQKDVLESIGAGRLVILVAGSGRTADMLVGALQGEEDDDQAKKLAASGLLQVVDSGELADVVREHFSTPA